MRARAFVSFALVATVAALTSVDHAAAQSWPTKPVRLVVPWPAGGPADTLGRVLATHLTHAYKQQFFVDNKGGAAANLGADAVAKSEPDGYTLLLCPPGPQTQNQFLYKRLPYNPKTDFTPIVLAAVMPLAIMSSPTLPINSVAELVAYARKNPGKLNYASPGLGSMGHLSAEMFRRAAKIDIVHIPYRGSAPALQDLLGGTVQLSVDNAPSYLGAIQSGSVRALAVTTGRRWTSLDSVPTMQELGYAKYETSSWNAVMGPAKLPQAIVASLNLHINEFLRSADGKKQLSALGYEAIGGTTGELQQFIDAEVQRMGPLIKELGLSRD